MEQIDTDYTTGARERRPSSSRSRLAALFLFPFIGVLVVLFFIGAAVFQWNISGFVNVLVGILMLLFILLIVLLFWGLAPDTHNA